MHCGVLCDKDGNVIRSWVLVGDGVSYEPVADGDEVVEWEADHGAYESHPVRHGEIISRVERERQEIEQLRTKDDALAHNWKRARIVRRKNRPVSVDVPADVVLPRSRM